VTGFQANHLAASLRAGLRDGVFARVENGRDRSFADLWQNAGAMAAGLVARNVRPGDRVAVQAEKSFDYIELYLGCILAGAIFLPLNPAYTPAEVALLVADAEPTLFVGPGGLAIGALPAGGGHDPVARGPEDIAAILYTSGTTGRPKGAMLSHRALASNAGVLAREWRFTPADVLIHALPVFHTHGLFVATNTALVAGASLIFQNRFDAGAVVAAMPQATVLMGVPTFYTRLLGEPGLARAARHMRLFISGSAPLLAETHRQWLAVTGHAILERYGMTETNMNTSNPHDGERRPGTVGLPLPGVELRLTSVSDGAGMIELRGPNLFSGYWRNPARTAEDMREGGWFVTGDLGRIDADGYLTIVGRQKDLIITGGLNVYPKEVEEAIDALPGVTESAVIGVPHPDFGEAVVAVVTGSADEAGILAGLTGVLARFKQPKRVILQAELPRNSMGKVQKKALRDACAGLFAES
jgi:malonyl-CoA/methylmalonyl-CoA synthetase